MADLHETFQVVAPANTPQSSPVEIATLFNPGVVSRIHLRIPGGHASGTGIQIAYAHQPVIPYTSGAWILGNNSEHDFTPHPELTSGAWSVFLYNTDMRAHYWQLIYYVAIQARSPRRRRPLAQPLPIQSIYSAVTGGEV